ncbi:uncharacterized protein LOC103524116 [Trichonephila clavipes]|nr:uncharacterized protein LOC103524116 [Trichonephila clavipes]
MGQSQGIGVLRRSDKTNGIIYSLAYFLYFGRQCAIATRPPRGAPWLTLNLLNLLYPLSRELLGKIKGKIVFQWVPSHCGLWGNERAYFLAKKGTGILQNFRRDLTLHSAKLEIKRIFRESFRLTASRVARDKPWSTLCKKSHGIPSSPRAAAVAKFRLLTGHDCLYAHLFCFNLVTSPICVLCDTGQDMTAAHLDEGSALNDLNCIVKRYWRARCLMT